MKQRGAVLWLPARPPTDRCSQAIAGGNDEVGKTVESQAGAHDLDGRCYDE